MARRIWIIKKDIEITQEVLDDAEDNNCPEIVHGIPPRLEGVINEASLPMVFEEPEPEPVPEPRDPLVEIDKINAKIADYDDLKARIEELEKR